MNTIKISKEKLRLTDEISQLAKARFDAECILDSINSDLQSANRMFQILQENPKVYFDLKDREQELDRLTHTRFGNHLIKITD